MSIVSVIGFTNANLIERDVLIEPVTQDPTSRSDASNLDTLTAPSLLPGHFIINTLMQRRKVVIYGAGYVDSPVVYRE